MSTTTPKAKSAVRGGRRIRRPEDGGGGNVTVRMYRDILGDSFLLGFPREQGRFFMLIDCGILQGMPGARERARRIAADIARTTGSRLDVLVVTHEHVDHLSCFAQASDIFETIDVDELWLAWTEDGKDETARRLREGRKKALAVLERSFIRLAAMIGPGAADPEGDDEEQAGGSEGPPELAALRGLMAFSGRDPLLAPGSPTSEILESLKARAGKVRYLVPGEEAFQLPGLEWTRVYVLGPPRDETLLRRSTPSRRRPEVYQLEAGGVDLDMFLSAASAPHAEDVDGADPDRLARLKLSLPFGLKMLQPWNVDEASEADTPPGGTKAAYMFQQDDWRRIDSDWLGAAEDLALKLDSDTNNTSLVLAMEVGGVPDAPVLLFPGDAQVGNWLSWQGYVWPAGRRKGEPGAVDMEDLLRRTVLYKVGHHGSHNATLREHGLELMTHRDLVALIPVEQEFANKKKRWNMPFPSLLTRLEEKTQARVIRADRGKADLMEPSCRRRSEDLGLRPEDWDSFLACVTDIRDGEGHVAIEYRLPFEVNGMRRADDRPAQTQS